MVKNTIFVIIMILFINQLTKAEYFSKILTLGSYTFEAFINDTHSIIYWETIVDKETGEKQRFCNEIFYKKNINAEKAKDPIKLKNDDIYDFEILKTIEYRNININGMQDIEGTTKINEYMRQIFRDLKISIPSKYEL